MRKWSYIKSKTLIKRL